MPIDVLMPALSPTMTEGKIAKWNVKEGDKVTSGTVLAEIETDKATMEVEAIDEGILGKILVPGGTENVAVNTPIAVILEEGEDASVLANAGKAAPKASAPSAPASVAPTPQATLPAAKSAPAPLQANQGDRAFASPLAKRLATQGGVDVSQVKGSGPHGRVVKADVEAALAKGPRAGSTSPAATPIVGPVAVPAGDYEEVPLSSMRKTIARRLVEAKQTIPHFYLTIDVELDALLELRQKLNSRSEKYKLSVNDFIIRACGLALKKVPDANSIWAGDKILKSRSFDVSVAVALEAGLITPIIRHADQKGLVEISADMRELATRAKAGKLKPEEYQGGAFSLSNLGMFGIKEFAAVINPPQGSILAVGSGEQRPLVKNGALSIATMMSATLSCDHRVIDGALGAKWLAAFKGLMEDPITMML